MVVVHAELMARAGVMVNRAASQKDAYLTALSDELDAPMSGISMRTCCRLSSR